MEEKKLKKLTILKIFSAIIFIGITIYLIIGLVDALNSSADKISLNIALYFTFIVIIFGTIGNALALIPAVIGLIYTAVKREKGQNLGQLITFAILTALPFFSQAFFMLFCILRK